MGRERFLPAEQERSRGGRLRAALLPSCRELLPALPPDTRSFPSPLSQEALDGMGRGGEHTTHAGDVARALRLPLFPLTGRNASVCFFMGDFFALCQSRCCALVRDAQVRRCNLALLSTEKGGERCLLPCLSSSSYTLMHPEAYIFFSF